MAEGSEDKTQNLKESRNRAAGLAVFFLAAAGGLGYMFNLSPLSKPDLGENNVEAYTEQAIRQQISRQFQNTATDVGDLVIETGNKSDTAVWGPINFGVDVTVDRAQARTQAIEQIKIPTTKTKEVGNPSTAVLGIIGCLMAGAALSENRKLKTPAP
jgi:hypothetical protein